MRRKLFNLVAAVSLVICVMTVGMWVRSYYRMDVAFTQSIGVATLVSGSSEFGCYFQFIPSLRTAGLPQNWSFLSRNSPWAAGAFIEKYIPKEGEGPSWDGRLCGAYAHLKRNDGNPNFTRNVYIVVVSIPYWQIVAISIILPISYVTFWFRLRRRHPAGACQSCGYDLRATPDRCPECGKEVAVKPAGTAV